jgi:hypothetical protein
MPDSYRVDPHRDMSDGKPDYGWCGAALKSAEGEIPA